MRAVDTNVLVRLLTRDDAKQATRAEEFVAGGGWISQLVLTETVWVLSVAYGLGADKLATAIEMLLGHEKLSLEGPDVVRAALAQFRKQPSLGFSDCLMLELARAAQHLPLGTFDKELGKLAGAQRL